MFSFKLELWEMTRNVTAKKYFIIIEYFDRIFRISHLNWNEIIFFGKHFKCLTAACTSPK